MSETRSDPRRGKADDRRLHLGTVSNLIAYGYLSNGRSWREAAVLPCRHEYDLALLFVGALVAFCVSLIELGRDRPALHDNDLRK